MENMKNSCMRLLLLCLVLSASALPAEADLIKSILDNGEFVLHLDASCDGDTLYDIRRLDRQRIGIILLDPTGFAHNKVCDGRTLLLLFEKHSIPAKAVREAMRKNGILLGDAKRLVRSVMALQKTPAP